MQFLAEFKTLEGQNVMVITVSPKIFKTGSRGFYGSGKTELDGKRYQVQVQMVEIGSKKVEEHK